MPKTSKVKKKVKKVKVKSTSKVKPKVVSKPKEISKGLIKISKTYIPKAVSYTHLRAHETLRYLVCRLLLEKKLQEKMHSLEDVC